MRNKYPWTVRSNQIAKNKQFKTADLDQVKCLIGFVLLISSQIIVLVISVQLRPARDIFLVLH